MKRKIDIVMFMMYFIPLLFISMYADWHGYSSYIALLIIFLSLALASHFMWYGYPWLILIGNIISFVISLILVLMLLPNSEVGYYFKPLGSTGTLILFAVVSCVMQYIVSWLICKLGKLLIKDRQ